MQIIYKIALLMVGLFYVCNVQAGAWLRATDKEFSIHQLDIFSSSNFINVNGDKIKTDRYLQTQYNHLLEWGYNRKTTLGMQLSLSEISQGGVSEQGYSESRLFSRHLIYDNNGHIFSVEPSIKLPSFTNGGSVFKSNNEVELAFKLNYGRGFAIDDIYHFWGVELQYNRGVYDSFDGVRDTNSLNINLDFGFRENYEDMWLLQVMSNINLGEYNNSAFYTSNHDKIKLQMSYIWSIAPDFSVQIGAYKDIYARNTGQGQGVVTSIWFGF